MSVEIKDLVGLSEPITKLIEEVSKGIGGLYRPLGTILNAKAEEFKMKKLTDGKAYQIKVLKNELTGENNELIITDEDFKIIVTGNSIESRAIETMVSQEVKKQINLDSIINKAIEFIKDKPYTAEESVDTDWMTRFINISQDISNEEMQNLWAQVLSNEVLQPKSYSLRTLETLRSMSSSEAKLFTRFANLIFKIQDSTIAINDINYLESNNISLDDLVLLKELNLINTDLSYEIEKNETVTLEYGNEVLVIDNKTSSNVGFNTIKLSIIGKEIHSLIEKDYKKSYLEGICKFIQSQVFLDKDNFKIYKKD